MPISLPKTSAKTAVAICLALATHSAVHAAATDISATSNQPVVADQISTAATTKKTPFVKQQQATYIVRLAAPSIAAYNGSIPGLAATSIKHTGKSRLDTRSPEVNSYRAFLASQQRQVMDLSNQTLGRNVAVKHQYKHVFNGLAMALTAKEADAIASLPNVLTVEKERFEMPTSDVGPGWIGA